MTRKYKRFICPKCGGTVCSNSTKQHQRACEKTPPPAELVDIIEQDTSVSIKSLTRRYGVSYDFIRRRLADTRWTTTRLARRGLANQYGWGAKCECGFLLADGEKACKWCRLRKERGITDYHGLLEVGAI